MLFRWKSGDINSLFNFYCLIHRFVLSFGFKRIIYESEFPNVKLVEF